MGLGQIFFAEALHTFFVDVASYDSLKFHLFLVTKKWCHILIDEIRPTTRCDSPTLRCPSTFLQRVRSYRIMARCWLPKARCCGKKFGTRNWESNNESDMILINRVISCCNVFSMFCTTVKDSFIFVGPFCDFWDQTCVLQVTKNSSFTQVGSLQVYSGFPTGKVSN